jgi:hypothetical protein
MKAESYDDVISDLIAKRDAMNELIAALANMRRLDAPLEIAKAAEEERPSVRPSVQEPCRP